MFNTSIETIMRNTHTIIDIDTSRTCINSQDMSDMAQARVRTTRTVWFTVTFLFLLLTLKGAKRLVIQYTHTI